MKNLKLILAIVAIVAFPFFSNAQFGMTGHYIQVTYSGKVPLTGGQIGALRVTTNTGDTHDYTTYPTTYNFITGFTSFTFDFSHAFHPGWGNAYYLVTISKSTLDAQAIGSTVNYYMPNMNRYYQITKGPGYSITNPAPWGTTYDYTLDVKVREPYL